MELAIANLETFAATLLELARQDSDLLVVTSDSRGSAKLAPFAKAAPGQIVEVGIAEQNLVGVAAGGSSRQKCLCRFARLFSDGPLAGADQKRPLLLGPAGYGRRHQRRCQLRSARNHPPFLARLRGIARHPQHNDCGAG